MNVNETAKSYYAAIGEFVVAFAMVEMHISKFISAKQAHITQKHFGLSVTIAANFDLTKKAKKLNDYINFNIPTATAEFKSEWKEIYEEIVAISEARNFLVHGLCLGFVHYEPIDTFLTGDKNNMVNRKFMLAEIVELTAIARKLFGILTGDFWHKYARLLGYNNTFLTALSLGDQVALQRVANDD